MIKGMDLSFLEEVELCGGHYYDNGEEKDCLQLLKDYGCNLVRLRLWNDPYNEKKEAYGAGRNDIENVKRMALRCQKKDLPYLLDFHYSDFWADPGKQVTPKAWQNYDLNQLEEAVYQFTLDTLKQLEKVYSPQIVAIGNEVTNGLLWPIGKVPNYANIARLISAGLRAVKDSQIGCKTMIHLDNGGNNELYRNWFDNYFANGGVDFDYIGLSYYAFWHGTMDNLRDNMNDIADRYHKDLIVAETSFAFTMDDYQNYERLSDKERKGMAVKPELLANVPYPTTKQGQSNFIKDLGDIIKGIKDDRCKGFIYWAPEWLPVPGSQWASDDAVVYMSEKGPSGGNEWANQALFDYDGNALPALETIKNL